MNHTNDGVNVVWRGQILLSKGAIDDNGSLSSLIKAHWDKGSGHARLDLHHHCQSTIIKISE